MAKGLIDSLLDSIFDEKWVGKRGEKLTERELSLVNFFGRDGVTLRNLYIPKGNGETSEIDLVYITQKGVFVLESKNYSGWIFGNETEMYWTASLSNGQKNRFYNPIKQNRSHIKWLRGVVGEDVPLFSVIVFSERCELKKVSVTSTDVKVVKRDRLYAAIRTIWDASKDALSPAELERLCGELKRFTNKDAAVKEAHIEAIRKNIEKREKTAAPQTDSLICPRCGKALVVRTARKGPNAGQNFYACSGFPQCRYTCSVETKEAEK